jgi:transcriptional regulator with XRE-family HTH domain
MRIKELREEKQISQKKLAEIIGTSQRNIGRWENEENEPSYLQIVKLADFFECSIDYLVGREDDFDNVVATTSNLTERESRLLKAFGTLSALEQDKLIADAEFYALHRRSELWPIKK